MNFDDMSDAEINKAVAIAERRYVKPPPFCEVEIIGDVENYYDGSRTLWACHASYCDSPDDAWPIIVENKIEVAYHPINKYWYSSINLYNGTDDFDYRFATDDENPLRAAVVVYLKMKEAEK